MQAVLLWKDMAQVADKMDPAVFQYVGERQTESFEALEHFDLLAFDWYDVRKGGKSEKVRVYLDQEDLFFFCRDEAAAQYVRGAVQELNGSGVTNNQQLAQSNAKEIDLLVTWLFRLTQEYYNYKMAAVLGIMVFIVCAVFTVVCFHFINKKEATFS